MSLVRVSVVDNRIQHDGVAVRCAKCDGVINPYQGNVYQSTNGGAFWHEACLPSTTQEPLP